MLMDSTEAKAKLKAADDEEPVILPVSILDDLTATDLPEGVSVEIGAVNDRVVHLDWNGRLFQEQGYVKGEADYTWTRKYWYAPIGLEHYLDLVGRAVEVRHREHGDVELSHYDDDGAEYRKNKAPLHVPPRAGVSPHRAPSRCPRQRRASAGGTRRPATTQTGANGLG